MLMYIACLCPNLHFYAILILHFKFHLLVTIHLYMYCTERSGNIRYIQNEIT